MATLNGCAVGDIVKLYVGGVLTDFIVAQKGTPAEDAVDYHSSMNNIWLMMKDIHCLMPWGASGDDYEESEIHSYLNGTFLNSIGRDVAAQIVEARIPYTSGTGTSSKLKDGTSGLRAKVFLLAAAEISTNTSDDFNTEGSRLEIFSDGTSAGRIAYFNGAATEWWTRTHYTTNNSRVRRISANGSISYANVTESIGVRPVLLLPKTTVIVDGVIGEEPSAFNGHVTIGGVSKELSGAHANVGGVWKEVSGTYMNVDGVWKPMA